MKQTRTILIGLALYGLTALTQAQTFPSRPITLTVPVAPGGILDTVARMIAPDMSRTLGQTVIVENKPGASGNIAAAQVARLKPDGHTLLVGYSMFHVGNPSMFPNLQWDPIRDFASVSMLVVAPHVIAVNPAVPAHSLKELVQLAQARPGKLSYASPGSGSVPHVGMELFKQQNQLFVVHIPYKGAGPAMQDVIGGTVDMTIATPPSLMSFVQAGRLRALAVAAKERHPLLPNVPTTAEAGYPKFELEAWVALFAPAGTPGEAVNKLAAAAQAALRSPEVQEKVKTIGVAVRYLPPTELDRVVRSDLAYWSKVIREARITAD
ncbi:MAG: tripartite tricarboxylate transporter substrate binding protein [Burkholderiaceae bacterium]